MQIFDPVTHLPCGDSEIRFPRLDTVDDTDNLAGAFSSLILSASGWRKVFAADGNEESVSGEVAAADLILAAAMTKTFADFVRTNSSENRMHPGIAVGIDARYTGPVIASVIIRVLLSEGFDVRYLFIVAAPEIMAYVRETPALDGFIYISASHNPVGHNGVKFGLTDGGVLGGNEAEVLIEAFRKIVTDRNRLISVCGKAETVTLETVEEVFKSMPEWKKAASLCYFRFCRQVVSNESGDAGQDNFFRQLENALRRRPLGILGELNGSARSTSIDRDIFVNAGFTPVMLNDKPRQIVHRIVPEGRSLDLCRRELARLAEENPAFELGYVPDNDGDRGNLVYYDRLTKQARIIEAQEVFALAVLAELSFLSWSGGEPVDGHGRFTGKVAVAVNGPTSMRIDRLAGAFNAKVFRAEVGEANVVTLARRLRARGYTVRILGEGSNGGNITHPSAVRDPLSTVFAVAKLLCLDGSVMQGPFGLWLGLSGRAGGTKGPTVSDLLASLPPFVTTSAYEPEAIMRIRTSDHALLKKNYEKVFTAAWAARRSEFEAKYGIVSFREINTEGTEEKWGFGPKYRSGKEKGGFKIQFYVKEEGRERPAAYIWLRGSGTEPVFRVLADVEGDRPEMERELLTWHREMIEEADSFFS